MDVYRDWRKNEWMDGWILLKERIEGSRERLHWREGGRADRQSGCPSFFSFLLLSFLFCTHSLNSLSLWRWRSAQRKKGWREVYILQQLGGRVEQRLAPSSRIMRLHKFNRATTQTLTLARGQTEMSSHALPKTTSHYGFYSKSEKKSYHKYKPPHQCSIKLYTDTL